MIDLADAQTVRKWAMAHARNMSVATMHAFRQDTGRGISRAGLIDLTQGTRIRLNDTNLAVLTTNVPTDASLHAEWKVYLLGLMQKAATPAAVGGLAFEVGHGRVDAHEVVEPWRAAIERLNRDAQAALAIAHDGPVDDDERLDRTLQQVLATRDPAKIAAWGHAAARVVRWARLDVLMACGLEVLVDDALVGAADLG